MPFRFASGGEHIGERQLLKMSYHIRPLPREKSLPGSVIELKVLKKDIAEEQVETELKKSADIALRQIDEKQYVAAMKQNGIEHFLKIGITFYKKHIRLLSRSE